MRRAAAQPARRNVRRPSPQAGVGGQRRRAAATAPPATPDRRRAFMLSSLRPRRTANSCSGRRVETEAPVKVFTGPADHPDAVQVDRQAQARPRRLKQSRRQESPSPRRRKRRHAEGNCRHRWPSLKPWPPTPRPKSRRRQAGRRRQAEAAGTPESSDIEPTRRRTASPARCCRQAETDVSRRSDARGRP